MNDHPRGRIDFYVLRSTGDDARRVFACRLAEKAWRLQNSVHLRAVDRQEAGIVDELLWTFRDGSFVPHELLDGSAGEDIESPVTIGWSGGAPGSGDLLINLTAALPEDADAFPRVAEIVTSDDDSRRRSRKLFAEYRSRGYALETHNL